MRRLVIENSEAVIPPENYLLGITPQFNGSTREEWCNFCRKIISAMSEHKDWVGFGIDEKTALELFYSIPDGERTVQNFWHTFHAIYAKSIGKPNSKRWGDKTPLNVGRLSHIAGTFPGSLFVFMVRDALDTSYSYGCVDIPGRLGKFLDGARRWVDANHKVRAFSQEHPDRAIIVRYEDLVTDPEAQLDRVLRFLKLERCKGHVSETEAMDIMRHKHLHNVLGAVRDDFIGRGHASLPANTRQEILAISHELQRAFGYGEK